ncbi:MAG: DUF4192 domain-containing protein [Nakamurella sp.]
MTDLVRIGPYQVGFMPTESLVIQCLEGNAATRVMRIDLPAAEEPWQRELELIEMSAYLSAQLDPARDRCLVVIYSHDPSGIELAAHVGELLRGHGRSVLTTAVVDAHEILLVSADGAVVGREPIEVPDSEGVTALKAVNTLNGRRVLADRAELAASVAAPASIGEAVGRQAVAIVVEELDRIALRSGEIRPLDPPLLTAVLQDALGTVAADGTVSVGDAARLAVYCWNPRDRDSLLAQMLQRRSEPWIPVLVSALRRVPADDSVDLCSVLVVVAYRAGDGALAQVAADRVLQTDGRHRLTLLMLDIMFAGLPPDSLDGLCAASG